jgi:hypothetical protein
MASFFKGPLAQARGLALAVVLLFGFVPALLQARDRYSAPSETLPGLTYTNCRVGDVPWSIHIVQLELSNSLYEIRSFHAGGLALGLDTLSDQLSLVNGARGTPVAALNGDFYQRERTYAGAPRGLQVVDGELLSAPSGSVSFWIDALNVPHTTNVESLFHLTWPDGTSTPFGLNGERRSDSVELYTPAAGTSTHTRGGRELVLEQDQTNRWLPLRLGMSYSAHVREVRNAGDTHLERGIMILSLGPVASRQMPDIQPGAVLRISTACSPALHGVKTAISGGPILLRNGKRLKPQSRALESYEYTSMFERHPRAAIGWNDRYFFFVEVDGRQRQLSVGMTLNELSTFLQNLGCTDGMNFDGGGSATLWYQGEVRNSPCDRAEREIANCLVIVSKPRVAAAAGTGQN